MSNPIVILGRRGSRFGPALAEAIASRGTRCDLRSIDAAHEGGAITVDDGQVGWEGIDPARARVVFLEQPLYSWPQPSTIEGLSADPSIRASQIRRQREACSVTLSAVRITAQHALVVNHLRAGALTASRPVALIRLEAAGIPVHPWKMIPGPPDDEAGDLPGLLVLDGIGAERWHVPGRPAAEEPCLALPEPSGEVHGVLVAGGAVVGQIRYPSAAAWRAERAGEVSGKELVPVAVAELALAAAAALELEVAEVWISGAARHAVLLVEAGPDLEAWDRSLRSSVVAQLAGRLIELAASTDRGSS